MGGVLIITVWTAAAIAVLMVLRAFSFRPVVRSFRRVAEQLGGTVRVAHATVVRRMLPVLFMPDVELAVRYGSSDATVRHRQVGAGRSALRLMVYSLTVSAQASFQLVRDRGFGGFLRALLVSARDERGNCLDPRAVLDPSRPRREAVRGGRTEFQLHLPSSAPAGIREAVEAAIAAPDAVLGGCGTVHMQGGTLTAVREYGTRKDASPDTMINMLKELDALARRLRDVRATVGHEGESVS